MNCINLSQIDLSEVIEFGMESFSYCQSLTSLDLASAKVLGAGAFLCASKVATVSIPVLERIEIQALRSEIEHICLYLQNLTDVRNNCTRFLKFFNN